MRKLTQQDIIDIQNNFPIESCLKPPEMDVSLDAAQAFDRLMDAAIAQGPATVIDYRLPYPKYLFLDYLTATRPYMLHGSTLRDLKLLKPLRLSTDSSEFGNQDAIYATQDPLWALFFAVLNRGAIQGGISNGAIQLKNKHGVLIRRYYFAVDVTSLHNYPWMPGAVYILPSEGFEPDPALTGVQIGDYSLVVTHWLYRGNLQPLAVLPVEPGDFPFLHKVWGYDMEMLDRRMSAESVAGWPFLDDAELYPIMPSRND